MIKSRDLTSENSISFQGSIEEKKEQWNLPFQEYGVNQLTTQMIATFVWLIRLNVELERMLLQLFIPVFLPQLLLCHILINCRYPFLLVLKTLSADESATDEDDTTIDDYVLNSNLEEKKPYYPNQKDLNDLIRDLGLTKSNAELLTSRLKQWNLLDDSVQITQQRKRHQSFSSFFTMQNAICFCNNVSGLFYSIGIPCISIE